MLRSMGVLKKPFRAMSSPQLSGAAVSPSPGRPGDGLTAAPLSCGDDIARNGFFKTPMLRNIALTAPYFHNGGQLTLEQVVEFYNRGGDFPDGFDQIPLIDPNIVPLGLTTQEKTDLVDFLRNGLTDPRTVNQSAQE